MAQSTTRALSVVVGSHNAEATIAPCLESLLPQCDAAGAELLVVDNSTDSTKAVLETRFPEVTVIPAAPAQHIPELWGLGMQAATGDIVAITTAHAVPASDWVPQILHAHAASEAAGIGGCIENDPAGTLTDWAICFCRYSRFMPPLESQTVLDIAGDNASYKRWALERYAHTWRNGFWEPDVHAAILKGGGTLHLVPDLKVCHTRSFDVKGFVRNRWAHGQQYGGSEAVRQNLGRRLLRIAQAPLVPFVLLRRVAQAVWDKQAYRRVFVRAVPLILLFYVSWAMGEAVGYLRGTPPEGS